jgi:hypothetical protein
MEKKRGRRRRRHRGDEQQEEEMAVKEMRKQRNKRCPFQTTGD